MKFAFGLFYLYEETDNEAIAITFHTKNSFIESKVDKNAIYTVINEKYINLS